MGNRLPVKLKIFVGFAMAAIGLGTFLFITFKNSRSTLVESKSTAAQLAVMKDIEEILDAMQDIETANRGFLLSGDSLYLQPYFRSIEYIDSTVADLRRNSIGFNEQYILWPRLSSLIDRKLEYSDELIRLRSENKIDEARELFLSGKGRVIMEDIRSIITDLEHYGREYFKRSGDQKDALVHRTRNNFLILSALILAGLIIFYMVISRDLDANASAQRAINRANDKIVDLYDNAPCGYITTDRNLTITEINRTALTWLGYDYAEIAGKRNLRELTNLNPQELLKRSQNVEVDLITKDGEAFPVELSFTSAESNDQYRIVLIDISGKKLAEYRINYFEQLINQTSDAIISTDNDYVIRSWNRGAERLYGYTAAEAIGKNSSEVLRQKYIDDTGLTQILETLKTKSFWSGEVLHHHKDGKPIHIIGSVSVVRDSDNKQIGYVAINQDITERKLYEERLKNFNSELVRQVEAKTKEVTDTLERLTDAFFAMDNNFNITLMNSKASAVMEKGVRRLVGKNFFEVYPDVTKTPFAKHFLLALEKQQPIEYEDLYPGTERWYNLRIFPSSNGLSVFFQDVSDRHQNEIRLIESERKYKLLFENNPFPMWVLDGETLNIRTVNKAAVEQYGYSFSQFVGQNFLDMIVGDEEQKLAYRKKFNSPYFTGVVTQKRSDGRQIKVEIFFYEIVIEGEERKIVVANDVTDLLSYQEELKESRDQLRQLSSHLESIREEERSDIAREIHDELGQQLTGLKMNVAWISKKIGNDKMLNEKITAILSLIDDTVKTVRRIATNLRPGILDDFGLIAALDWQSREFERLSGIRCSFRTELTEDVLEKNIATGIFRIYQEALTNVARHSKATQVITSLTKNTSSYKLIITDNGVGMPQGPRAGRTLGLLGMQERALMMNGLLNVISEPGKGTTIELEVPFSEIKTTKQLVVQ